MTTKLAILQMSDTPQVESSALMLRSAGYDVMVCGSKLRDRLKRRGCDAVVSVESAASYGCDRLDPSIREASEADMDRCDLFCEIKVNNLERVWAEWPRLRTRTAWWRVNGARPEVTPHGGDETNPPCPVVGANLWYGTPEYDPHGRNYVFWPPYPRSPDYDPARRKGRTTFGPPFCLCHGVNGWGFYAILARCVAMGVNVHGAGAPAGLIPHSAVPNLVGDGLAMVHVKSVDCPGWALYEALLGGCPVVVARLLINRMRAGDLFVEGETCMAFGPPGDATGRGDMEFDRCVREIAEAVDHLKDPALNRRIGLAGRDRLLYLMWREDRVNPDGKTDGDNFRNWLERNFVQ